MKNLIPLMIVATLLWSCNQTKKEEEESPTTEQVNEIEEKSVLLSVEPYVFKLSELPDTLNCDNDQQYK